MFGGTLDVFLAIIFSLLAVVFFMGKGKGILELFGGKQHSACTGGPRGGSGPQAAFVPLPHPKGTFRSQA